ncbi:MAG: hypothetical protein J3K34DRAFT_522465 [Monoraphidium minutum]|nr:MAG: hypothetical protein J3K34DRAFT_522465 [Monoraphidium minutum]
MLEPLGPALVARILRHLPRGGDGGRDGRWTECVPALAALRAARQVCKLFDEAARLYLIHTLSLTHASVVGGGGGGGSTKRPPPPPPRSPRACLACGAGAGGAPAGAAAAGCLASVTALELRRCHLGRRCLQALLTALPAVEAVRGDGHTFCRGLPAAAAAAGAAALAAVHVHNFELDAAGAAALSRLPRLAALDFLEQPEPLEDSGALAALPCGRLTRLGFRHIERDPGFPDLGPPPPRGLGAARFPQLCELRNIALGPAAVPALAGAAPRLRLLTCWPAAGAWGGGGGGGLPNVTHALFMGCPAQFLDSVDLGSLLPALQDLSLQLPPGAAFRAPRLGRLPALRALSLASYTWELAHLADWAALPRGLTRLAAGVDAYSPDQLGALTRLTALEELAVDYCLPPCGDPCTCAAAAKEEPPPSACALLEVAARLPRLRSLVAASSDWEDPEEPWDFDYLGRFATAPAAALTRLELRHFLAPPPEAIAALAARPGLRRLVVARGAAESAPRGGGGGSGGGGGFGARLYAAGSECVVAAVGEEPLSGAEARLSGHRHYVQGVAWDPLGRYVISLSADRTARVHAPRLAATAVHRAHPRPPAV